MSPQFDFGLSKSEWRESRAHYGCGKIRSTSVYFSSANHKRRAFISRYFGKLVSWWGAHRGPPVRQRAQPPHNLTKSTLEGDSHYAFRRTGCPRPIVAGLPGRIGVRHTKAHNGNSLVNQWASNTSKFIGASVVIAKPRMWSSRSARTIAHTSLVGTVLSGMKSASIRSPAGGGPIVPNAINRQGRAEFNL